MSPLHRLRDQTGTAEGPRDVHPPRSVSRLSLLLNASLLNPPSLDSKIGSMTETQNELPKDAFGHEFDDEPPIEVAPVEGANEAVKA